MSKKVRIFLYLFSMTVTVLVLTLLVFHGRLEKAVSVSGESAQEQIEQNNTEEGTECSEETVTETEAIAEDEKAVETETQQEDTILLFGGDVLIHNISPRMRIMLQMSGLQKYVTFEEECNE